MPKICIFMDFLSTYFKNHAPHNQYNDYFCFRAEKETTLFQRRMAMERFPHIFCLELAAF